MALYHLPAFIFDIHLEYILREIDAHHGTLHDDSSFVLNAG